MSTNVPSTEYGDMVDLLAFRAVVRFLEVSTAPHMWLVDPAEIHANLMGREHSSRSGVHRFGAYVLVWDVARPWYATEEVLIEDLLIKVYPEDTSVSLRAVLTEHLPALARELGVPLVFTGDTQGQSIMERAYESAGYTRLGGQFMLEVD